MIHLVDVNEKNWIDIIRLSVNEEQQKYLDRPIEIIARGYIYRNCNGRVFGIADDCVNREDAMALHVYEKVGFVDSGYIDDDLPDCLNLIYHLR